MAYLLVAPYFTGIDSNGVPLAGGKVYTYAAGTTIPQASYTDYTGITPAANPVVLDSAGRAGIWLVGSYKIVVKDSLDNTIGTADNVFATAATATELNYLSGVTPGTATASKALVIDSSSNLTGLATNTFNTASTGIANMTAVQGSMTGGFINKFRNPRFDVASRGVSGTVTTGNTLYTIDGWMLGATGATVGWQTIYGSVPGYFGNVYAVMGAASLTDALFKQRIESTIAAPLASTIVTVQISVSNFSAGTFTPTLTVKHPTAQDNWGATATDVSAVNLQPVAAGATVTLCYSFTSSASSTNGLEVTWDFGAALNGSKTIYLFNPDIRATPGVAVGLNSLPPTIESRPIQQELAFCQRYLPAFGAITGPMGIGAATSTSASGYYIPFHTSTFIAPTALTVTTVGNFEIASFAGADVAATSGLTFSKAGPDGAFVTAAVAGTPLTSATSYFLYAKIVLAGNLIFTGSEL